MFAALSKEAQRRAVLVSRFKQLQRRSFSTAAGSSTAPGSGVEDCGASGGSGCEVTWSDPSSAVTSDPFTAALQQKAEDVLRRLVLKDGQQQTAESGEAPKPVEGRREIGGYAGPEPTRYKDWEIKGRASDF